MFLMIYGCKVMKYVWHDQECFGEKRRAREMESFPFFLPFMNGIKMPNRLGIMVSYCVSTSFTRSSLARKLRPLSSRKMTIFVEI